MTYGYHPTSGNLTTLTSTSGEHLTLAYTSALVTGVTWTGAIPGTHSVEATYDSVFRVNQRTVNGADPITLGYDNDGLLTQAGALTLARDPHHGLVTGTSLGVISDTLGYNAFGELESYTATADTNEALAVTYTHDALGRIDTKTESVFGGTPHTTTYGYDARGRLETMTPDSGPGVTYTYDDNGNRLSREVGTSVESGTYDAQDRLVTYGNATYSYTANGELESKRVGTQTTLYHYDPLGNLRTVTLADGTPIEYVIDPVNRRVGKKVSGTLVQGFFYEDQLRVAAEVDGVGNLVSRFVYGTRANVPEYMVRGGVTYRLLTDHLGSPRLVINTADGTVAQRMDYDEFGRVTADTNPGFQPFGYAGGLYDRDTGLVRFGARDYDAATGRWTAKDPLRFGGEGANLYTYVFNDPVNALDSSGLMQSDIDLGLAVIATALPGLDVPSTVPATDLGPGVNGWTGILDPSFPISVSDRFLSELNDDQALKLLDTLIHEVIHHNETYAERFANISESRHDRIYRRSGLLAQDLFDRYQKLRRCAALGLSCEVTPEEQSCDR